MRPAAQVSVSETAMGAAVELQWERHFDTCHPAIGGVAL